MTECAQCHSLLQALSEARGSLGRLSGRMIRRRQTLESVVLSLRKAYEAGDLPRIEHLLRAHTPGRLGPVRRPKDLRNPEPVEYDHTNFPY